MVSRTFKIILTWFCVLLYIVIGTITLDSSDIAEAKATGQVTLLDSLDEYVIDSILEQMGIVQPEDESSKALLLAQASSDCEIGLSIEGAAPGNAAAGNLKALEIVQTTVIPISTVDYIISNRVCTRIDSRGPPGTSSLDQLLTLRTIILNI